MAAEQQGAATANLFVSLEHGSSRRWATQMRNDRTRASPTRLERESGGHRIRYLDGLRGIAIGCVITYHLYALQYAAYVPYGDRYALLWPAHYGWAGVELFFLISGFVILMTLEKCRTFLEFLLRRWIRLFPAMLVASLLIYTYDHTVHFGPYVDRSLLDLIPGITFLSPALIHAVTKVQLRSMDGPFWSLYVEAAFYVVFGAVYFWRGWKAAVGTIAILCGVTVLGRALFTHAGSLSWRLDSAMQWLGFIYFGWFAAGALFYKAASQDRRLYAVAVAVAALSAIFTRSNNQAPLDNLVALLAVVMFFAAAQVTRWLQAALSSVVPVFLGFISYPLYLIHSNVGIGLTQLVGRYAHITGAFASVLPLIVVVTVAWFIARYVEPPLRGALQLRKRTAASAYTGARPPAPESSRQAARTASLD